MSNVKEKKDVDYAEQAVPEEGRKGFVTMFMIMLGFTFFSASMWVGQQLAAGENFWEFLGSLILGGCILGLYTGLLAMWAPRPASAWICWRERPSVRRAPICPPL